MAEREPDERISFVQPRQENRSVSDSASGADKEPESDVLGTVLQQHEMCCFTFFCCSVVAWLKARGYLFIS